MLGDNTNLPRDVVGDEVAVLGVAGHAGAHVGVAREVEVLDQDGRRPGRHGTARRTAPATTSMSSTVGHPLT